MAEIRVSNVSINLDAESIIPEDVFSHLEGDEKKKAIAELKALLKPSKPPQIVADEIK